MQRQALIVGLCCLLAGVGIGVVAAPYFGVFPVFPVAPPEKVQGPQAAPPANPEARAERLRGLDVEIAKHQARRAKLEDGIVECNKCIDAMQIEMKQPGFAQSQPISYQQYPQVLVSTTYTRTVYRRELEEIDSLLPKLRQKRVEIEHLQD